MTKEIFTESLNTGSFFTEKINDIRQVAGDGTAINALPGGVDSSVITLLCHQVLGSRLRNIFIQNGMMREGEPEIDVGIIEAEEAFLSILIGITDPEKKCEAITQALNKTSNRSYHPKKYPAQPIENQHS